MNESRGVSSAVAVVYAVAEAIRDLGQIPNGHLYAQLCGHMSFDQYSKVIAILKRTGAIDESHHVLRWIGPPKEQG